MPSGNLGCVAPCQGGWDGPMVAQRQVEKVIYLKAPPGISMTMVLIFLLERSRGSLFTFTFTVTAGGYPKVRDTTFFLIENNVLCDKVLLSYRGHFTWFSCLVNFFGLFCPPFFYWAMRLFFPEDWCIKLRVASFGRDG